MSRRDALWLPVQALYGGLIGLEALATDVELGTPPNVGCSAPPPSTPPFARAAAGVAQVMGARFGPRSPDR